MYIALAVLICVLTIIYVTSPFWRGRMGKNDSVEVALSAREEDREALLEQRDNLLLELKELEFDFKMGKMDEPDYQELRASTATTAAEVLQRLEELDSPPAAPQKTRRKRRAEAAQRETPVTASANGHAGPRSEIEAEIEILIARSRSKLAPDEEDSRHSPALATAEQTVAGWQCTCGRKMSDADLFCGSCGKPRS